MRREWPTGGIPMRVTDAAPSDDGEWWAELVDEHHELFIRIKLVERPRESAVWQLHLYDPSAIREADS